MARLKPSLFAFLVTLFIFIFKEKLATINFMAERIFISTAIPYVNASPHIGFALEIVQADVLARYYRKKTSEVFFLTGTDENSLTNVRAAMKENMPIQALVDRNANRFRELKNVLNLSFDDFIRTTEERHIKGAQKLWLECQKDIYKKKYRGLYCVSCETFYTERELMDGLCPEHRSKPELIEEENYFFKLTKYKKEIKEVIESDKLIIIPKTRKNEILSFINSGLQDFCISRSKTRAKGWGIEVPGDENQVMWVWFDALSNYINALGYGDNEEKFNQWWQNGGQKIHMIGKGIIRFHAVYWPAMLLSAGISLPNTIFVHGYITREGQKMSKTIGNIVDPVELVQKFGIDPVRYYLLREIPATQDGDYSERRFREIYKSELQDALGNLVQRVTVLALKNDFKKLTAVDNKFRKLEYEKSRQIDRLLEQIKFNEAVQIILELIKAANFYIDQEKPWSKDKKGALNILSNLLFLINEIGDVINVFLPETSERIKERIFIENDKVSILIKEPLFKAI